MKTQWMKALILMVAIVALLTVAGCIQPKDDSTEPSGSVTPSSSAATDATTVIPGGNTDAPTDAPAQGNSGWVEDNGRRYYYIDGVMQRDTVVGSDADGYYYVDADGARADGYCNAVNVNGVDWNVIEGKATRVNDEWDKCLNTALSYVGKCTDSSMSREEKLRAAFEYIKRDDVFLEGVPDRDGEPYYELNWPVVCANELMVGGMGDCYSYGAAFAFIGQAIGYDNCYACTTGGHGWAEIEGRAYDPEWDMHHQEYNHFGVLPEDDCDVAYFTSLTEGVDWMYVNVAEKPSLQ